MILQEFSRIFIAPSTFNDPSIRDTHNQDILFHISLSRECRYFVVVFYNNSETLPIPLRPLAPLAPFSNLHIPKSGRVRCRLGDIGAPMTHLSGCRRDQNTILWFPSIIRCFQIDGPIFFESVIEFSCHAIARDFHLKAYQQAFSRSHSYLPLSPS